MNKKYFHNSAVGECCSSARCAHCVLPCQEQEEKASTEWVCELCKHAEAQGLDPVASGNGTGDIEEIIEKIRNRGRGRAYDCIVGLSGGRDSSYLAYLLIKKHQLRCLGVYYRTPFTHQVIDDNVKRITERLKIKLVRMELSQDDHIRVAQGLVKLWKKSPLPELSNLACAPCKLLNHEVFRVAQAYGVKSIIFGGNGMESMQYLPTYQANRGVHAIEAFGTQSAKLIQILKKGIGLLFTSPQVINYLPIAIKASLLYLNPHSTYLQLRYPNVFRVDYFYHAPYCEAECVRVISDELGWRLPPGYTEMWRADCAYASLKDFMYQKMVNVSYLECLLSNLVRAGQITREEALVRLEASIPATRLRIAEVMSTLGLPKNFLEDEMN